MDQIPLKQMILPLVVLDDTPYLAKDPNHAFSVADLKAWEEKHGRVPAAPSPRCAPTCTRTGTRNPERFKRHPFRPGRSIRSSSLRKARHRRDGHESMDTDTTDEMKSETWILQHGHCQIEVMANLDKVPATGALIVVSWPKVKMALAFRRGLLQYCRERNPSSPRLMQA